MLADPFSFPADLLLRGLDYAYPGSAKAGGLASAGERPGQNALLCDGDLLRRGAVGVALTGAIAVDTVVAQGCRAIGEPMKITRASGNFVVELDGRPPLEVLKDLLPRLSERDQKLARSSLFLGVGTDPLDEDPEAPEYLIRNILGVSSDNGALAVGELVRVGQAVRFHLRDALSSSEDLDRLMARYAADLIARPGGARPAGALLFSCLGRGQNLYGRPDHDTDLFREKLGRHPARRILRQRRDRLGPRIDAPPRLHQLVRAVPRPLLTTPASRSPGFSRQHPVRNRQSRIFRERRRVLCAACWVAGFTRSVPNAEASSCACTSHAGHCSSGIASWRRRTC